jgi:hypothetical protein
MKALLPHDQSDIKKSVEDIKDLIALHNPKWAPRETPNKLPYKPISLGA